MGKAADALYLRGFVFSAAMCCCIGGFAAGLLVGHHATASGADRWTQPEQARLAAGIAVGAFLAAGAVALLVARSAPIDDEAPGA